MTPIHAKLYRPDEEGGWGAQPRRLPVKTGKLEGVPYFRNEEAGS